jgi:thymidylate kinase
MKSILKKLGYSIATTKENIEAIQVELLFINNPDNSIRWVWNANCKKAVFLKFYNIGSFRAFAFATAIRILFFLRLQKIIFKKRTFYFNAITAKTVFDCTKDWSLFMGTIGLNSKAILYANPFFYKIAITKSTKKMVQNEYTILSHINVKNTDLVTPKVTVISKYIIQLTDISNKGRRTKKFTTGHLNVLTEMSHIQKNTIQVSQWQLFQTLKEDFEQSSCEKIPKNITRKLNTLIQNCVPNQEVKIHLSQGDFTQWNMYQTKDKIAIYDWELGSFKKPKGYDYFHYMMQQGILVERKSWKLIYQDILKYSRNEFGDQLFDNDLNECLQWYLLINCMYNMDIYAKTDVWYPQIHWMLVVWNEALNVFIKDKYTQREMIIMDLFDLLQNQEYAALKYPKEYPEDLSINSDIDLVITKETNSIIMKYLKNHSLVSKINSNQRSFMNTIQVFTVEGSILSIDLIWQLKIKNYEILSTKQIIANNYKNNYGAKNASEIDTARFIILFYTLNGALIPEKYLDYKKVIEDSKEPLDLVMQNYFDDKKNDVSLIQYFIKLKDENSNFSYLKNTLNYCIDTLKNNLNNQGFTVTFSGVDGAGKSTVIDVLAYRIEKQLRKPVVVLRHRPSLLPILSVWTKGKQKAHQDATNNLPRQGKNKNVLSSFARFSYYYLDFLIGQFVVYFKYILRGYVVIYDRYYFDFINDSKRSNIILSKKISSFGYQFLLKPKFNFFLFADANTILERKKELSKTTIELLTDDYKNLFLKLKSKSHLAIYESIKNEDLEVTLNYIVSTIIQAKK